MRTLLRIVWKLIKLAVFAVGGLVVLLLICAAIMYGLVSPGVSVPNHSVLVFDLNTRITDRSPDERTALLARLVGQRNPALQLRTATTALREAAQDQRISALYLHGNFITTDGSSGYGALSELRDAIYEFRKSGKPVIAYVGDADNRDFCVMSAANQILLNPSGVLAFRGLAASSIFFKDAGDRYGFEVTAIRRGKYKGAVEPLTRENYSPDNREQLQALINSLWGDVRNAVAESRGIATNELQALVDKEGLIGAPAAKAHGLVTELGYEGDAISKLRQLTGTTSPHKPLPQVALADYAPQALATAAKKQRGKDKIAVIYAEGDIGGGQEDVNTPGEIPGPAFARMLRQVRQRKDVKAVVLRVNSPGGSGEASDVILDELRRFGPDRPIIVSMGSLAASGGYFISMAARRILAEPETITGSIGVFGLTLDLQKLANNHGVTYDSVQTAPMANIGTLFRPMTPQEHTVMQNLIDHFYDGFLDVVAQCRHMTTNRVDEIAEGHVWSGADALKIGLVDEMGGLEQAISIAAKDANLGTNYSIIEFPEMKGFFAELSEASSGQQPPLDRQDPGSRVAAKVAEACRWLGSFNDPHGIYARLPFDLQLN